MSLYLVTGGGGFIGSYLARRILERGDAVRIFDNFSTGHLENLSEINSDVEVREGDVRDLDAVRDAIKGCDFVLHQAALPSVPRSVEKPLESHEVNATGTLHVLLAARDAAVKRVVYASSSSVYGRNESLPKVETMATEPLSPYAISKLAGEHYCVTFRELYGLPTVALRYFNVFGPRQDPNSPYSGVVSRFMDCIRSGEPPTIHGDGEQTRDFTYVDNVAQANLAACQSEKAIGGAFNIGCNTRISINQLWSEMASLASSPLEPIHTPSRAGDVPHSLADIGAAREALGYDPSVDFRSGLSHTLGFYDISCAETGA